MKATEKTKRLERLSSTRIARSMVLPSEFVTSKGWKAWSALTPESRKPKVLSCLSWWIIDLKPENLSLLAQQQVCLREPNLADLVQIQEPIEFLSARSV